MLDLKSMAQSLYFYDTETSGIRPSTSRIMQFAGQRTDMNLQPLGEPDDILIKLSPDILPEPDAVLVHGITPQQTVQDGITEAEFARYFQDKIATPDTIFVGFNSVRFDDEFVRYMMYRNFYEPYEWQWKNGRSRWDLMDALRMMRALRPEGIEWPFDDKGGPTVRLELMTAANGLLHENAHTALADVQATIDLARLMRTAQPKLFDFLLNVRGKKDVQKIVEAGEPFVYTSGKYSGEGLKTTLVATLLKHPKRDAAIVYDLRHDPEQFFAMSVEELAVSWRAKYGEDVVRLPIKTLQYNRCPAVAPQVVLDKVSCERIGLDTKKAAVYYQKLQNNKDFTSRLAEALGILEDKQSAMQFESDDIDTKLYDSFWSEQDKHMLHAVISHAPATLADLLPKITNKRLHKLLPLYKARNYSEFLTPEEHDEYEAYRQHKLLNGGDQSVYAKFALRLQALAQERQSSRDQYLLTELQLYAESIMPFSD
jgi:exodeoxyribonuclease-1